MNTTVRIASIICLVMPVALLVLPSYASAQTHWRAVRAVDGNEFQPYAISRADSINAIMVGYDGFAYGYATRTDDGGRTWNTIFSDSNKVVDGVLHKSLRLYDVAHPTSDLIIIAADSVIDRKVGSITREELRGVILRSTNSGSTWAYTVLDSAVGAFSISMADPLHGLVSNGNGLQMTTDGGNSWSPAPYPDTVVRAISNAHAVTPTTWILLVRKIGVSGRVIYRTTDAGSTWEQSVEELPSISKVRFQNESDGWGVGTYKESSTAPEQAVIARTSDGGITWTTKFQELVGSGGGLNDIAFSDSLNGRAVGDFYTLVRTTDGGETWAIEPTGVTQDVGLAHFFSIDWSSDGAALIGMLGGYILRHEAEALPAAPLIVYPVARSEDQPLSVAVEWQPVPGAISYDLQVSNGDAGFTTGIVVDEVGITGTSFTLSDLEPSTTYAIRVRTVTATNTSNWSSLQQLHVFTTGDGTVNVPSNRGERVPQLSVFPNPLTSNHLTIRFDREPGGGTLRIFNLRGRVVYEESLASGIKATTIDLRDFGAGVYQLVVDYGGNEEGARIVIVN